MLALLLGLLFSSGIHAQNFYYTHNSDYGNFVGMNQYRVADGETYTSGTTNTDPTADLTMDCLAANGYGQWTVSTAVGSMLAVSGHPWIFSPDQGYPGWSITQGWFLLGNSLTKPSEKYVSSDPIGSGSSNIGNIDHNFWGFVACNTPPCTTYVDPNYGSGTNGLWDIGQSVVYAAGLTYNTIAGLTEQTETAWSGSISCGGGFTSTKPKNNLSLSIPQEVDSCTHWKSFRYDKPQTPEEAQIVYDTLRLFVEKCAASDPFSFQVFSALDGAVGRLSTDTNRYVQYRDWLLSILYLNTTVPEYFCNVMGSISGTYSFGKYKAIGYLAIHNYLRQNHPECWNQSRDSAEYAQDSAYDAQNGYDVTHLPSMHDLGLDSILYLHESAPSPTTFPLTYLVSFTSSPNPFANETTLQFALNRVTFTTVAVYDELGRLVWGDGRGSSLEAGVHTIHIDASTFPSGTLYARISTGFGEVKTVKLIHEK